MKNITAFTSFYPSRPFWAINKVDLDCPNTHRDFTNLMSEEVFEYKNSDCIIKICRDGRVMIRIEELEKDRHEELNGSMESTVEIWGKYLEHLNAFYLLLDSSTLQIMNTSFFSLHEITNRDAFRVNYVNGKSVGENIATESIASVFQMARYISSYRQDLPLSIDNRLSMRAIICEDTITKCVEQYSYAINHVGLINILASFAKSISEYKVGNYETAVILSWFISEKMINKKWENHLGSLNKELEDGSKRINSKRREFLTGRDYTISIITNMLELSGLIAFDEFQNIDKVRGFRNKIVHSLSGYSPSAKDAQLAIRTTLNLVQSEYEELELLPSLSYSINGI